MMAESAKVGGVVELDRTAAGPGVGIAQRITTLAGKVWAQLANLPAGRRNVLLASVALLGAVTAAMAWYAARPDWRVLFSGLDARDVQQVSQELAAANVPFQLTVDGTGVQVPADVLDKARMEVAAKGMPQTGRLGFELFDKPNWVGSEFDEKVNYQRALEGELEHTISTLGVVRSARVHLVLPAPALFASEERLAKASVVLKLSHQGLPSAQADSIRNLVAGAVENLAPEQVVLVDADGHVNLQARGGDALRGEEQQRLEEKLVAMLEPLAGRDNVRATVNVSYDDGREERTDEIYDPAQTATLSLEKTEQSSAAAAKAAGVPGTASNSPAAAPAGSVAQTLPVYPSNASPTQSAKQESGVYGVTKHTVRSESGPSRVRRVSAAIVVNDRSVLEGTGKQEHLAWKPRGADEMKRLEQLAQAAVGYDVKRGDAVVIENVGFSSNVPEAKATAVNQALEGARSLLKTQPGLLRTTAMGLVGVLLVMFCLRPVARQVTASLREPMLLGAGTPTASTSATIQELPLASSRTLAEPVVDLKEELRPRPAGVLEHVAEHVRREPQRSTRVLEAWIARPAEKK